MTLKKVLRNFLIFAALLLGLFALFLGYQSLTAYRPAGVEPIAINCLPGSYSDTLNLVSWNIGYAGLGKEMDFFYEGGTMVRPKHEQAKAYLKGIIEHLSSFEQPDFILLQEVDTLAHRSWDVNQYKAISSHFADYCPAFALNYKAWVPMPMTEPMGRVRAGLMTLSRQAPLEVTRHAYADGYSWPMSLFMLNRCFMVARYQTESQKQLVVINLHNSAFSDAAEIREKELAALKSFMETESGKGNYVIAGGDWNQNPAPLKNPTVDKTYRFRFIHPPIPDDFLPVGWQYAWDPLHSTNRDVDIPYTIGTTTSTIMDFFVISPDIELLFVKTLPTGFDVSDHQPVEMKVVLK